jgi:hypothetical protein
MTNHELPSEAEQQQNCTTTGTVHHPQAQLRRQIPRKKKHTHTHTHTPAIERQPELPIYLHKIPPDNANAELQKKKAES